MYVLVPRVRRCGAYVPAQRQPEGMNEREIEGRRLMSDVSREAAVHVISTAVYVVLVRDH